MIFGNIDGIKKTYLEELERLYKVKVLKDEVCSVEIIDVISRLTSILDREISVAVDRRGKVVSVAIGDSTSVEVSMIDIREKRLSGVRVIHTHPNGFSNLSALDISALLKLKLDAIMAIGVYEGKITDCSLGMITITDDLLDYEEKLNLSIEEILTINILDKIQHVESMIKEKDIIEDEGEKAILVGSDTKESLEELKELTKACDIPVLDSVYQSRSKIDPAFYIGKGKVLEIASLRQSKHANLIIFDDELSGSQVRNLEAAIK